MNLSQIIKEEIHKYVSEIIQEKYEGRAEETKTKIKSRDGHNVSTSDETSVRRRLVGGDNIVNVAALARKLYPDHTPEGAQSQLRKKLKGEKNDNGSEYHLKERELGVINAELKDI